MEYWEDKFQTFDNLSSYQQCWKPDEKTKAVVIIVQSSFEHSLWLSLFEDQTE